MAPRLDLQALLEDLIGSRNVYFQPPAGLDMEYPAIRYKLDSIRTKFADNSPYKFKRRYQLTYMDRDPDSDIPDKVVALPLCSFDRFFTADNLNHYVFNLFF